MKFLKIFLIVGCLVMTQPTLHAHCCCEAAQQEEIAHFGTSGFGGTPDKWYPITTHSYPEAVLLSQNRNNGTQNGGVYLSPTGFTISEEGDYWVEITAIFQNPAEETVLIPVFLGIDDTFDADAPQVGGVITLQPGVISTMHGTGIVRKIAPGTRLSLLATNAGAPFPQEVTVVSWSISLFKLSK